jgi:myo-inositol-1(or 4)-monophosphatase
VTYHAGLGRGAYRGRRRLRLAPRPLDDATILGVQWHRGARTLDYLDELVATGGRVRNLGCTVAQLCDVAAGRLDANVQEQGKLWDFAAAALVVTEAGGLFTDWHGAAIFPVDPDPDVHQPSIAAHPTMHRRLCAMLSPHQARIVVPDR